jgi:hypothetical protein
MKLLVGIARKIPKIPSIKKVFCKKTFHEYIQGGKRELWRI